ncbi:hypothetical protein LzC2_34430 [Planctomycetes bacterium LzC2]|uniref:Uncharacterized protein n=1 Tax=Alienimonas chondri TaxID=2681879 RepID=A0ABX1VGY3_9PLAN|nr:hypothetical protein [Alienimonas chondri]
MTVDGVESSRRSFPEAPTEGAVKVGFTGNPDEVNRSEIRSRRVRPRDENGGSIPAAED